jgi:hypothetical protein
VEERRERSHRRMWDTNPMGKQEETVEGGCYYQEKNTEKTMIGEEKTMTKALEDRWADNHLNYQDR